MTPNEYKEAAEQLLNQAEKYANTGDSYNVNRVQNLTSVARVYAILAAIPDTTVQDRMPFDTGKRRHMVDVGTNDDTDPGSLAIQHRRMNAELAHNEATDRCKLDGCYRPRAFGEEWCQGHGRDTVG